MDKTRPMLGMQSVTIGWLSERGGLHDARVRKVRTVGSSLEMEFSDEWAAFRGLGQAEGREAPGILVIEECTILDGEPAAVRGGWISEVSRDRDELKLLFCDRPPLTLRAAAIWWRSAA